MRIPLAVPLAVVGGLVLAGCGGGGGTSATESIASPESSVTSTASPSGSSAGSASPATTESPAATASAKRAPASATAKSKTTSTTAARPATTKATTPKPATPAAGRYIDYGDYSAAPASFAGTDVVLFFHAPWCPKCQDTEKSIKADGVPAGLTIVKVDFDSSTSLRQKYGVTLQHTYVQVDPSGTALTKWTGTYGDTSVAGIAAKTV